MNEDPTEFVGRRRRSDETEAVIRALRRHDQAFADLFESIELLLEEPLVPGWRRFVAHSGRELTAGLPDVLIGSSIAPALRESVDEVREDLHTGVDQDESPPVQENHKHRIAQMVSELTSLPSQALPESQYVDAFWEVHSWFQKRAHQRRDSKAETEDRADYVAVYQRFRRLLAGLLADYPTTRKALDPILDRANAQPWRTPTLAQVAEVIQLTPRLRESDFFFGRLDNPLWLDTLTEIGAFDSPPKRVARDGYLDLPRWPISEFLARVAAAHPSPEAISAVVLGLASTDNLRVQADLLRAAIGVAPTHTADLTPHIRRWIADTSQGAISIILDEIGVWMVHQAGDPEMRSLAVRVLRSLVEPVSVDHETQGLSAYLRLPNWDLQRFATLYLIPVSHVLPLKTIEVLAGALGRALTIERGPTGQEGRHESVLKEDFSSIWLERVGAWREGGRGADIALAQATFVVASAAIEGAPLGTKAIVAALEAPGWVTHSRLSLGLLSTVQHLDGAKELAFERLASARLYTALSSVPEVNALLTSWFPNAPEDEQLTVLRTLSQVARDREQSHTGSGTARFIRQLWLVQDSLAADWQRRLARLVSEHGEPDEPEHPLFVTGWVSRESPLTDAGLSQMEPSEIARYTRSWTPLGGFDSPNRESLAAAIRAETAKRPDEFAVAARLFIDTRAIFVRAVLDGLNDSRSSNPELDWGSILALCEWSVAKRSPPPTDDDPDGSDDAPWRWVRDSVAQLLHFGSPDHSSPGLSDGDGVWAILSVLLSDMEGGRSGLLSETPDFVHHSLNSTLGRATDAAIWWGIWLTRGVENRPPSDPMPRPLDVALRTLLADQTEQSLVARASIGHYLPQLIWMDSDWVESNTELLFPSLLDSRFSDAVWDSYLRYGQGGPTPSNYRALSGQYLAAVEALDPDSNGTRPEEGDPRVRLGTHLVVPYLQGDLELDGILTSYFDRAPELVRQELLNWLGRDVRGWQRDDDPPVLRAKAFWEWREKALDDIPDGKTELLTLAWWCASGLFEPDWIAERLVNALSQGPSTTPYYYNAEDMLDVVVSWDDDHVLTGLTILRYVVEQREWAHHSPYLGQAAAIIRRALSVDRNAAYDDAVHIVDLISRAGHSEIEEVLN